MKRESWHYKMARMGNNGDRIWSEQMSICEYTRKVIFGSILFTVMMSLLGVVVFWLGLAVWEIIGSIFGFAAFGPAAATLIGGAVIIGFLALHMRVKEIWQNRSESLLKKENNSFVAQAYKSYKDKFCFTVKFDDE